MREREVQSRIRITDAELAAEIARQRAQAGDATQYNIAQILVAVPEAADASASPNAASGPRGRWHGRASAKRSTRSRASCPTIRPRSSGGALGLRPANRLPDSFVAQVRDLQPGQVAPTLLRSGAGFHVLKLIERRDADAFMVKQTRARHILLRPSRAAQPAGGDPASGRLQAAHRAWRRQLRERWRATTPRTAAPLPAAISAGLRPAAWCPNSKHAMNALPVGGISDPVVSRFGVHLIQVIDRRDLELDARAAARIRPQRAARAQVRSGVRELARRTAGARLHRDARGTLINAPRAAAAGRACANRLGRP